MPNSTSAAFPNLGNDPSEESPPARVLSNRELRELRKREKKAQELKEKLEVRYDPQLSRQNVVPTPPQNDKKQRELEREKEEKQARELKEKLVVYSTPSLLEERYSDSVTGGVAKGTRT